jgi:hypothetical protein
MCEGRFTSNVCPDECCAATMAANQFFMYRVGDCGCVRVLTGSDGAHILAVVPVSAEAGRGEGGTCTHIDLSA